MFRTLSDAQALVRARLRILRGDRKQPRCGLPRIFWKTPGQFVVNLSEWGLLATYLLTFTENFIEQNFTCQMVGRSVFKIADSLFQTDDNVVFPESLLPYPFRKTNWADRYYYEPQIPLIQPILDNIQAYPHVRITVAHEVNEGRFESQGKGTLGDLFFIEREEPEAVARVVHELATTRVPSSYGLDPLLEIQVLTPMHKGLIGTEALK